MKSRCFLFFVMFFLAFGLFSGGGVSPMEATAVAADFVWDGSCLQPEPGIGLWTCVNNWTADSGIPDRIDENAVMADTTPSATCIFDVVDENFHLGTFELRGESPTKMKLHVRDDTFITDYFDFDHYGQLDCDQDFDVKAWTILAGTTWIEVLSGKICELRKVYVNDSNAVLNVTNALADELNVATDLLIDCDDTTYGGAIRALRFTGGKMSIDNALTLRSETDSDYHATFWLDTGEVTVQYLDAFGGPTAARRAGLHLDQNFTVNVDTYMDDHVVVQVAAGKTFNTKKLSLSIDTELTVSGLQAECCAQGKLVAQD